jgi:hypothetical protein
VQVHLTFFNCRLPIDDFPFDCQDGSRQLAKAR